MPSLPHVSVVVPAHNSQETIERCLESLLSQKHVPREIIVVDDRSRDRTADLASRVARVIRNNRAQGPGGARNAGAEAAQGPILAFIDSDCIAPVEWLSRITRAFEDDAIGAVGGGYAAGADESFWQRFCCEELLFRRRHRGDYVPTLVANNMACRKDLFHKAGGFPERYPVCEDMYLSHQISRLSRVRWLSDNGVVHRFKNGLKGYLKHQYYFAAESVRFFLHHPRMIFVKTHQGHKLYAEIFLIFTACFALLAHFYSVAGLASLCHFGLYIPFLNYLHHRKFSFREIARAYGSSWLRDFVCGLAVGDGVLRAVFKR